MRTENLTKGTDPNALVLIVEDVRISPTASLKSGQLDAGILIKFNRYNLENILCQMIEDYGQEKLIEKIKSL